MNMLNLFCSFVGHWSLCYGSLMRELNFCICCIRVFLLSFIIDWFDLRVSPLWFVVASYGVCLFLLWRNTEIDLRLFCIFMLQLSCQASPNGHRYLGSVQITASLTDMCCYHCCNNYSSDRELKYWLMIITSLFIHLIVEQSLTFIDSVSIMDQLVVSLDEKCLVCSLTFHALWSSKYCIPCHWVWETKLLNS